MSTLAKDTRATVIPCLSYREAHAAIDWLCRHFGFVKQGVYEGDDGKVVHAELSFGNGMIMLGSTDKDSEFGRLMATPAEVGGRQTQTAYVITSDPDEIYRRAKSAGVAIVLDIEDKPYGGRGFSCRDLEGYVWSFGSYDPWASQPAK
jgi:uncharacterized glyoxalase superfamily protein PhnB